MPLCPSSSVFLSLLLLCSSAAAATSYPTWCGKYYQPGAPTTAPASSTYFQVPALSSIPLLDFQCAQSIRPYVSGDTTASIVVDASINYQLGSSWTSSNTTPLSLSISINGNSVVSSSPLSVNSTGTEYSFDLSALSTSSSAYSMECTATSGGTTYKADSTFLYLPENPNGGSVVKMDKRTGGMLVPSGKGVWEPLFPLGFFTAFTGYLDGNLTVLDEMKASGINVVHPIPTFDNQTAFELVLDHMEELGLWLMYDMRFTYSNATSREAEVNAVKNRTNLLLWYTGDEPDGSSDPIDATRFAYDAIMGLDGYHPISLVLNCADYLWTDYSAGADIIMQDAYPLFVNVTYSTEYDTICNSTFGCCGCDDCFGNMTDIATRIDSFYDRIHLTGRDRNATVWSTFQTFSGEFWSQFPTGDEVLAMAILSINHGSTGIINWQAPTTRAILTATTTLAKSLPSLTPFILSHLSTVSHPTTSLPSTHFSTALWTQNTTSSLLLVSNLLDTTTTASFLDLPSGIADGDQVLGGATIDWAKSTVSFGPFAVGGWTFNHAAVGSINGTQTATATGSEPTGKIGGIGMLNNPFWSLGVCATGSLAGLMCW